MKKIGKFQWGAVAASVIGSTLAMGVGIFADEIMDWLKDNKLKSKGKEYYKEMLKAHPALKKEEPKIVAQYWASLMHFAPHMAADPLSAGAFIRQSIARGFPEEFGGPPVDTYSTLTGINKAVTDARETKGRFTDVATSAAGSALGTTLSDYAGYKGDKDKDPERKFKWRKFMV